MSHDEAATTRARQVELILEQIDSLPTLSPIAMRLLSLGSAEDADLDRIVTLIETDPAMTARVLGLCRRADKGMRDADKLTSVRRAVIMLGLDAIRSAVLSVAVYELMQEMAGASEVDRGLAASAEETGERTPKFDYPGYWKHCIAVGCAAELLAWGQPTLGVAPEEAFVAGLLHDLGRLALQVVLPRACGRVLALAERRRTDAAQIERLILGLDHHTAGKRLAEHWMLPQALQDVMWLHSQPLASLPQTPHRALVGVVSTAKVVCRVLHLGWSGDFGAPPSPERLAAELGLRPDATSSVSRPLHEAVAQRCDILGLGETTPPELLLASIAQANRELTRLNFALEERAKQSAGQDRVLRAITQFHASDGAAPRSLLETFAGVVRSASGLFGTGFYGVLYQPARARGATEQGPPWQVFQFTSQGRLMRSNIIEPPRSAVGRHASLAALTDTAQITVGSLAMLPWLSDTLADVVDVRRVRLIPLRPGGANDTHGPAAALLHDRDQSEQAPHDAHLDALTRTWGAAVCAAALHDDARRMGERLAESTRALADAQARLTESEAMARLGEMTAGAAHEMNNPLTVISGRSQLLASSLTDERARAAAQSIAEAAHDLTDLITSLHLLANPPPPVPAPTSARELVHRAVDFARERGGRTLEFEFEDMTSGVPDALLCDRELVSRGLGELILNAAEAAPDTPVLVRHTREPGSGRCLIEVTDHGPGMSARTLAHAFDPFFSEKPAGRQRGLGLTRARRLIELAGGRITLESSPGKGTTARVALNEGAQAADTSPWAAPAARMSAVSAARASDGERKPNVA